MVKCKECGLTIGGAFGCFGHTKDFELGFVKPSSWKDWKAAWTFDDALPGCNFYKRTPMTTYLSGNDSNLIRSLREKEKYICSSGVCYHYNLRLISPEGEEFVFHNADEMWKE